jgi:hypothetical protein
MLAGIVANVVQSVDGHRQIAVPIFDNHPWRVQADLLSARCLVELIKASPKSR